MGKKRARRIGGVAPVAGGLGAWRRVQNTQLEGRNLSGQGETSRSARAFVKNFSKDFKEDYVNQFLRDLSSNGLGVELTFDSVMQCQLEVSNDPPSSQLNRVGNMVVNEGYSREDVLDVHGDVEQVSSKLEAIDISSGK